MPAIPEKLLFVDTNLFLDFYEDRKSGDRLYPLRMLETNKDSLIISTQVEMEYITTRRRIINENIKNINANIAGKDPEDTLQRLEPKQILDDPEAKDDVYKIIRRIFSYESPYNLSQGHSQMPNIYSLAYRRFCCGYPPRKPKDTTCGDSINWEWIIQCAISGRKDVVIASRDSDYRNKNEKQKYMNDWLVQEFKTRVGQSRTIALTDNISEGLNMIGVETDKPI